MTTIASIVVCFVFVFVVGENKMLKLEAIIAELVRDYSPELVRDIVGVAKVKGLDVAGYMVQDWCICNDFKLHTFASAQNLTTFYNLEVDHNFDQVQSLLDFSEEE